MTNPTNASVLLYQRIVSAMGQERADTILRFFISGFGHGQGTCDAGFDSVGVLDRWADGGMAPANLIAVDQNKSANRTRPMGVWPTWPRFSGADASSASSYICVRAP